MPVLQLYQPANMYALNLDHDYGTSSEEAFMTRTMLRDISTTQQLKVEMETRGQNGNCKWREARALRITASKFGEICRATERKDLTKFAESVVNLVHFSSKATAHGNKYEAIAVEAFEHIRGRTSECGLFISPDHPWLGASPDRILDDNSIVEVKCPFKAKDMLIDSVTVPYLQQGEKGLELKPTHIYHYQVQGQLMCSQRTLCYFCVYTLKDFKVIEIERNDIFIGAMVDILSKFFNDFLYPRLVEKHVFLDYGK
ncbi:uncharacterized protein LOC135490655 [Lineus longissimus]|uniref:uncharacterized protein LOC135490655 n=1 Tax=Lineus longissimus TaxID=88925 RepID=UPI002B4E2958